MNVSVALFLLALLAAASLVAVCTRAAKPAVLPIVARAGEARR